LHSPPSPKPQRASGACGKLLELAELGELGELVELGMQNIKWSPHLEGKCFFSCFFFLASKTRMMNCNSSSWVFSF
jgi:hypothetical protein